MDGDGLTGVPETEMRDAIEILPLQPLPMDAVTPLVAESIAEGYQFLDRLIADYESGTILFDGPGEAVLGAWDGGILVGIGGLTRDPFQPAEVTDVGRIRRVYVRHADRNRGIGAQLIRALEPYAQGHFTRLVLRAASADAARFYESLGYTPVPPGTEATHYRDVPPAGQPWPHQRQGTP